MVEGPGGPPPNLFMWILLGCERVVRFSLYSLHLYVVPVHFLPSFFGTLILRPFVLSVCEYTILRVVFILKARAPTKQDLQLRGCRSSPHVASKPLCRLLSLFFYISIFLVLCSGEVRPLQI